MRALTTREVREREARCGVPGFELMERAGSAIAAFINRRRDHFRRVVFLGGKGNNAGDAFVAAAQIDLPGRIYTTGHLANFSGEAAQALRRYRDRLEISPAHQLTAADLHPGDLVVDALLGIGYDGAALRGTLAEYIAVVNASRLPVLALDIPSGISGDTGVAAATGAIRATWTLALGAPKVGLFTGAGVAHRGEFHLADIGLPGGTADAADPEVYTALDAVADLPTPDAFAHKKSRGVAAVFAGSAAYPGAAALASEAALRGGAGLVRLFAPLRPPGLARAVIHIPATAPAGKVAALNDTDVLLAGPGWGAEVAPEVLADIFTFPGKVVLDADALNLLAQHPDLWRRREGLVLTPHPGEARRLEAAFGLSTVEEDRQLRATALAKKLHAVVIFKGKDSVVADPEGRCSLNTSGDWRLATAGSGDVLAGLLAGILATGVESYAGARLATFIHGRAAERLAGYPIADDLLAAVPEVFAEILRGDWL